MKECVTHHHACDCREKKTKQVICDLIDLVYHITAGGILLESCDEYEIRTLEEQAKELGYL